MRSSREFRFNAGATWRCIAIVAAVLTAAAGRQLSAAEPEYFLQYEKSKSIRATFSFEVYLPNLTAKEWVLFAAHVPAITSQTDVRTELQPGGEPCRDYSHRNRALLMARVPATTASLHHTVVAETVAHATLYSRHLVPRRAGYKYRPPTEPSAAERERSTAETSLLNFSDETFQDWLREHRLRRKRKESDLDLGRRAFLAITHSLSYDYELKMDRRASHLCEADEADCGGMCVLFVAAMRANGIPARMLCGRWAKSSKRGAELNGVAYNQQHVKAEFFAAGIGWVPVDLSSAVLHDKTEEGLQYFGHDRGDFLTVHVDPEIEVDTIHFGRKSFNFMQGFHYYVTGSGKLDGETMKLDWQVEVLP